MTTDMRLLRGIAVAAVVAASCKVATLQEPSRTINELKTVALPRVHSITRLLRDPDHQVIAVTDNGLARFDADLNLDPTFGESGVLRSAVTPGLVRDGAVDATGRYIIVGCAHRGRDQYQTVVARYVHSGAPDQSFGQDGAVVVDTRSDDCRPVRVFASQEGIEIVGARSIHDHVNVYVAKLTDDGTRLMSFGSAGSVATELTSQGGLVRSAELDANGDLVLVGYTTGATPRVFVARILADGTNDLAFGTNGVSFVDMAQVRSITAEAVALDAHGRVLIAGQVDDSRSFAARLLADGERDPSWGDSGFASSAATGDGLSAIAFHGDEVVAVGERTLDAGTRAILITYSADGAVDMTTGLGGVWLGSTEDFGLSSVMTDPDGGILVAGEDRTSAVVERLQRVDGRSKAYAVGTGP